uniref:RING-type E3 ubiquitin transferase n=1 Tax=Drosophila rhopaloa TaxID=1041015 RepID=A0A6P4FDL7_DRORH
MESVALKNTFPNQRKMNKDENGSENQGHGDTSAAAEFQHNEVPDHEVEQKVVKHISRGSQVNVSDLGLRSLMNLSHRSIDGAVNEDSYDDFMAARINARRHRRNRFLLPYVCNECRNLVREGVITICGHLFCWTCLWPRLSDNFYPKCPRCHHRLILHEDIVPFHGEGPNANPNDDNFLAQPGSVPRPTGLYLCDQQYPGWFMVNEPTEVRRGQLALQELTRERDLFSVVSRLPVQHPRVGTQLRFLKGFQLGCAILMCLLWGMVSLT